MKKCNIILITALLLTQCFLAAWASEKTEILHEESFEGKYNWSSVCGNGFSISGQKLKFSGEQNKYSENIEICKSFEYDNTDAGATLILNSGEYAGMVFRYLDENNYYMFRLNYTNKYIEFLKKVNGGYLQLIEREKYNIQYNTQYRMDISMLADNFQFSINEHSVMTAKDGTFEKGVIGFCANRAVASFDDAVIYKRVGVDYTVKAEQPDVKTKDPINIYVSPNGSDTADGSINAPLKTLAAAKEKANEKKKKTTPVNVIFSEGTYNFSDTVNFTESDSGNPNAPIQYMTADNQTVEFTGTKELNVNKLRNVTDYKVKQRMYRHVRDKIKQIDLSSEGITKEMIDFTASEYLHGKMRPVKLFLNGRQQTLARYPNDGYQTILKIDGENKKGSKDESYKYLGATVYYSDTAPLRWTQAENPYIDAYWSVGWNGEWNKLKSIDSDNMSFKLATWTASGMSAETGRWAAVNLLEEIDIPGEYYIDRDNMILYYYPPKELANNDKLEIAVLQKNMINLTDCSYVYFDGLDVGKNSSNFNILEAKDGGHLFYMKNCRNIKINNCNLHHSGRGAVYIDGGYNIDVSGCSIHDTGLNAVFIQSCGDRNTLTSGNVNIVNNDISNTGIDSGTARMGCIAIWKSTVGVTVKNNNIHRIRESAIFYFGDGHDISYNEFAYCINDTDDAGAVYSGNDWSCWGNVIHHNFIHDSGLFKKRKSDYKLSGYFLDDRQSGQEFKNNIVAMNNTDYTTGFKIGGGRDNVMKDNIFVNSQYGIFTEDRTAGTSFSAMESNGCYTGLKDIPYTSSVYLEKYPGIQNLVQELKANDKFEQKNTIVGNVSFNAQTVLDSATSPVSQISDNVILDGKDAFVDPENLDYRIKSSAKEQYGISEGVLDESFDISSIGIQNKTKTFDDGKEFERLYPEDSSELELKNAQISWEQSIFADYYEYTVATDADMTDIAESGKTMSCSAYLENLKPNTVYYWTVIAVQNTKNNGFRIAAKNGTGMFKISETEFVDTSYLENKINVLKKMTKTIYEGTGAGQYKAGTIENINKYLNEANAVLKKTGLMQSEANNEYFKLVDFSKTLSSMQNISYAHLPLNEKTKFILSAEAGADDKIEASANGAVIKLQTRKNVAVDYLNDNTSVYNFKLKLENLNKYTVFGLRQTNTKTHNFADKTAYSVLIDSRGVELQHGGKVVARVDNSESQVFKAGEVYDVTFGAVTLQNGVNVVFALNDEVIFDELLTELPNYEMGYFSVDGQEQTIEIDNTSILPEQLFQISDKIKSVISGDKLLERTYEGFRAENNTLLWAMEADNATIYKVSYRLSEKTEDVGKVHISLTGYAGSYETTVDMSYKDSGLYEVGTFMFQDADYVGRLNIKFVSESGSEIPIDGIKLEKADDVNMLK